MAMTLAQADLLTLPYLVKGVIETILEENADLLNRLPFEGFVGETFNYIRESTLPTASFYGLNEELSESSPTHTEVSLKPYKLIANMELDKFLRASKSDKLSLEAEYIRTGAKQVGRTFYDKFFYGDNATSAKEFSGLQKLVSTASPDHQLAGGADGGANAALSLATLDKLIDLIKPIRPDALFSNRTIRRRLSQSVRTTTVAGYITQVVDKFGEFITIYGELPLLVTDWITQTETTTAGAYSSKTGSNTSSVFAVKFGPAAEGGLFGIQTGRMAEIERLDLLEKKDSIVLRVKWYVGLGLGNVYSLAVINGITDEAVVA